ncbi:putative Reverse transcriptase [Seiridium cardinale]|uniref:Reverse transcriptase n=1 Tax=Seiridium cardinale TaxID=138064 RepID=A0ABR2X6N5_9PEZI
MVITKNTLARGVVGTFDPEYPDLCDKGFVSEGKEIIFTNVLCFQERLVEFFDSDSLKNNYKRQIFGFFHTLLQGSALNWWINEITPGTRRQLKTQGLREAVIPRIVTRFKMDPAIATERFAFGIVILKDIAKDESTLVLFIQRRLRYARAFGTLDESNRNWRGVIMQIWSKLLTDIKKYLKAPRNSIKSLEEYMELLMKAYLIVSAAVDTIAPYSFRLARKYSDAASSSPPSRRDNRFSRDRNRDYSRNRDSDRSRDNSRGSHRDYRRDDRDRSRDRRDYKDRPHRDDRRDRSRDRDDKRRGDRRDNKVHFVPGEKNNSTEESDAERGYFVAHNLNCQWYNKVHRSGRQLRNHKKKCSITTQSKRESIQTPSPTAPERRICGYCKTLYVSRNALFTHLVHCEKAISGVVDNPQAEAAKAQQEADAEKQQQRRAKILDAEPIRKKAPVLELDETPAMLRYTYLRVDCKANLDDKIASEICFDPGTGRSYIGRSFLKNLQHTVVKKSRTIKGLGNTPVRCTKFATVTFHLPGIDKDGQTTLMEFTKSGWVIDDELEPRMLIGNDLLKLHGARIAYAKDKIHFDGLDGFSIPFTVMRNSNPCVRKVTTKGKTTVMPGKSAYIAVDWKPLPKDRSFSFESSHPNIMHSIIDGYTQPTVIINNPSQQPTTIGRGTKVGRISEIQDSGYFVSDWKSGLKTLAAAATVALPFVAFIVDAYGNVTRNLAIPAVNAEFSMTPEVAAMAIGAPPPSSMPDLTQMAVAPQTADFGLPGQNMSQTPLTDSIFNMIKETAYKVNAAPPVPDPPDYDRPMTSTNNSTLGIRRPEDLPKKVTKEGIHIYAENNSFVRKATDLISSHPSL